MAKFFKYVGMYWQAKHLHINNVLETLAKYEVQDNKIQIVSHLSSIAEFIFEGFVIHSHSLPQVPTYKPVPLKGQSACCFIPSCLEGENTASLWTVCAAGCMDDSSNVNIKSSFQTSAPSDSFLLTTNGNMTLTPASWEFGEFWILKHHKLSTHRNQNSTLFVWGCGEWINNLYSPSPCPLSVSTCFFPQFCLLIWTKGGRQTPDVEMQRDLFFSDGILQLCKLWESGKRPSPYEFWAMSCN